MSIVAVPQPVAGRPGADELAAQVVQLGAGLKNLSREVHTIEERQVKLDRRLAEISTRLQTLQEDHFAQAVNYERGQKSVTLGAQRALDAASAIQQQIEEEQAWKTCLENIGAGEVSQLDKKWEAKWQDLQEWLTSLTGDIAAVRVEAGSTVLKYTQPASPGRSGAATTIGARLSALEEGQKAVAVSARRALHTALAVHQKQKHQEEEGEWEKCLDGVLLPSAELEAHCTLRFAEQDERLDKILQIVDALVDRVQIALPDGTGDLETAKRGDLRNKVEWLEANVHGLVSQVQQQGCYGVADTGFQSSLGSSAGRERVLHAIEALELRIEKSINDFGKRLDRVQESKDEQRLMLRKMGQQLPEVTNKLDQLWDQCQEHFPKIKEHDVHLGFFRASFEAQKQQMLELAEGLERRPGLRDVRADRNRPESPLRARDLLEDTGCARLAATPPSRVACLADEKQEVSRRSLPGVGEDDELKSRARTLAEVMAQLSAEFDSVGTGRTVA